MCILYIHYKFNKTQNMLFRLYHDPGVRMTEKTTELHKLTFLVFIFWIISEFMENQHLKK